MGALVLAWLFMNTDEARSAAVWRSQFYRFIVIGVLSNALGYSIYLLLTHSGLPAKVAMTLMYAIGVCTGYAGNLRYTFASQTGFWQATPRYFAVHLLGYLVTIGIHLIGDLCGSPHQLCQAVSIGVVAILLFFLLSTFVFRPPPCR